MTDSYIGNFSTDNNSIFNDSLYQIVFTYPATPKSVPLTNVIRKGNCLAFFFRTVLDAEAVAKVVKYAEGDFVNPCPHLTKQGVHYKMYQKVNDQWVEANV